MDRIENPPYPQYWRVGRYFQSITLKLVGEIDFFFLGKNKRACSYIREYSPYSLQKCLGLAQQFPNGILHFGALCLIF